MNSSRLWRMTGLLALANASALGAQFLTTVLVARTFGASAEMDAYALAISIPEALQYVLLLASLSIIFTPMFIDARARFGESEAWSIALSLLLLVAGVMLALIPVLWVAMPYLMLALAPGFAEPTRELAVTLARFILPGLIYYATAGILLGICFAYQDFFTAMANTVLFALLNLVGFFVLVEMLGGGVTGLMSARLLALGALQIFLVWRVRRLKRDTPVHIRLWHPQVRSMLSYLPPYTFGAVSGQAQLIVSRSLISTLGAGSIAAWSYGQRLAEIPMAIVGGAFGTTFLPAFAERVSAADKDAASAHWNRALTRLTLLLAPLAILSIALAVPLITVLFQRGAFDERSTQATAVVLVGLALGLPARGVGTLVARGLPAFKTRRVPILLSAFATALTIGLAIVLIRMYGLFGVALATSLGEFGFACAGVFLFWRWLNARVRATLFDLAKIFAAAGAMFLAILVVNEIFSAPLVQALVGGALGLSVYALVGYAFHLSELRALAQWMMRRLARVRI